MYGGNPNAKPPGLASFRQRPVNYGYPNPMHFGAERIAGQLGVQPNTGGTPTNSLAGGAPISYQDNSWRDAGAQTAFGQQYTGAQAGQLAAAQRPAGVTWHGYQAQPAPASPPPAQQPQGTSATSYGYQPLIYQAGQNQDAFIQQQQAGFEAWLKTPQGQQWALQNKTPQGQTMFGLSPNDAFYTATGQPNPFSPKPLTAGYTASTGWGMYPAPAAQGLSQQRALSSRASLLPPQGGTV